jgi:pre-mRNA-processing factor 6
LLSTKFQGQLHEELGALDQARESFNEGLKKCPSCIQLWILLSEFEIGQGNLIRARSILEKARTRNPQNPVLWLHSIRLEVKAEQKQIAFSMLARAMQECPNSGILWAEAIFLEPRPQRKTKSNVSSIFSCFSGRLIPLGLNKAFGAKYTNAFKKFLNHKSLKVSG